MKLPFLLISTMMLLMAIPVKAEIAELDNPSWQEVPGTQPPPGTPEGFKEPLFVNVNGITHNGDIVTYDLVDHDSGYRRLETNCKTQQFRSVRSGYFESSTRVNYIDPNDTVSWIELESSSRTALLTFVCNYVR